ncbi:hypothetical protein [Roseateles violae]|uniref:Flagellar motor switch protein FliG C-terminal domain-containing protein n=1 Tax=Roseateles violae TaxID=3058042 RepID=A0ABT8DMV0_9BURK|nr:hypothetical protein [Pelomonas sp. PFR6]MDN3919263.1 hypothetical protein [Pelomonas sp. PFR6]
MVDKVRANFWGSQIDDVMSEIASKAAICKVRLLDPGVIEAVLQNNPAVCGSDNPRAFQKLRELLMLGFMVREKSVEKLGAGETEALIATIRERLQEKLGDRLGGPPAAR